MNETKFTPGPWEIVTTKLEGMIQNFHIQIGEDQISVFPYKRIYSEDRTQSGLVLDEEKIANINLIAAAPELYEALEMLLHLDEEHQRGADDDDVCFEVRTARAALAKARGEG